MQLTHGCLIRVHEKMEGVYMYDEPRQLRANTQQGALDEPLLFITGKIVWVENRKRRIGSNPSCSLSSVNDFATFTCQQPRLGVS